MSKFNSARLNAFVTPSISALILRVFASFFMFYGHGWGKLEMVFNGNFGSMDPIGLGPMFTMLFAAFAEGICTIFVALGFYTRLAALFLVINMAGAFLFVHISDPFGRMELALVYLLMFLVIFLLGPGKYAIDSNKSTTI